MDANTKISRAKTRLLLDQPFWGTFTMGTPFYADDKVDTACTNGQHIKWNPSFVDTLEPTNTIFLVAHEIGHIVFQHCNPIKEIDGKPVDREVHNMALDYVLNAILIDGNVGEMPEGGLYEPRYHGWPWIKVYRELIAMDKDERPQPQPWGGNVGNPEDDNGKPLQGSQLEQHNMDIERRVFMAAEAAKSAGKLPAGIDELITKMRRSRVDWRDVFNRFIGGEQPDDYTWRRPQKRMWFQHGVYMPSVDKVGVGDIVVAVDSSGSTGGHHREYFFGVLNQVIEDHNPASVTVITCDAEVQAVRRYEQGDIVEDMDVKGDGGTRVEPVFRYVSEENIKCNALVYLTDMGIWDFPDNKPDYPVLWVSTDPDCADAPFGETTRIQVAA